MKKPPVEAGASGPTLPRAQDGQAGRGARRQTIVALYESRRSTREIAELVGLNYRTVLYHLEQAGIERRPPTVGIERFNERYASDPTTRSSWRDAMLAGTRARDARVTDPLLETRGRCGVPGCADATCDVAFGSCHCGCGAVTPIATLTKSERGQIRGLPLMYATKSCALRGRGACAAIEARRDAVVARYTAGSTIKSIATELRISPGTVTDDLKARGIARRPGGPRIYPAPAARLCACGCGRVFTPARGLDVARGFGLYASRECFARATRRHPDPAPRRCPGCGNIFTPKFPAWADQVCDSRSCAAVHRLPPRLRQKAIGRRLGHLGAEQGRSAGRAGGRPPTMSREQAAEIWRLHAQGVPYREIAAAVFGDERLKDRVARAVRAQPAGDTQLDLVAEPPFPVA